MLEVGPDAVEPVRHRRATRAPLGPAGVEHEVVDEQLRPPAEEVGQRRLAVFGVEPVLLVRADPRQPLPLPRQFVAAAGVFLLRLEQGPPRSEPFLAGSDGRGHRSSSSTSTVSLSSTSSQPVCTLAAIQGSASASSSRRSCTSCSAVVPSGVSSSVTVRSESKTGPSVLSGPANPQRNTIF